MSFGTDLLADMFTDHSPYHFGYNNPISFMDPTGLHNDPARPTGTIGNGGYLEMIDDYDGWAIVIEITEPKLPIPEHTVEFTDHSGSYGGGGGGGGSGGGSRSGSGSGNSGPKGASHGVLEGVQSAMHVGGVVFGFGELADGINAISYLVNGDYVNASLSMAAMSPIGGQLGTVGKLRMKATDATNVVYRSIYKSTPAK